MHDKLIRRILLIVSLANWVIAIVAWTVSAYLGIASPASIFVYAVLFIVGIFAVVVALACYILEKFAHEPVDIARRARVRLADIEAPSDTSIGAGPAAGPVS